MPGRAGAQSLPHPYQPLPPPPRPPPSGQDAQSAAVLTKSEIFFFIEVFDEERSLERERETESICIYMCVMKGFSRKYDMNTDVIERLVASCTVDTKI